MDRAKVTDLDLICRLETAARHAWPATVERPAAGGWLLRATPGLDRGRSNNALTPCRELSADEVQPGIERVCAFAREHSIRPGIQVSPLALHRRLQTALDRCGWASAWPTLVLTGAPLGLRGGAESTVTDHADGEWLRAWATCEPGRDVAAHARTVFELLRGRASFHRIAADAVGIAVAQDGLVGMFCVAVDPARRRQGLGTELVRALLASDHAEAELAYLQVEQRNEAALAMYRRLGFTEAYRYCHRIADGGEERVSGSYAGRA